MYAKVIRPIIFMIGTIVRTTIDTQISHSSLITPEYEMKN